MRAHITVAVTALLLAGCSGATDDTKTATTPPPRPATSPPATPTPGPSTFMTDLSYKGFGTKDTSDPAFLGVGNQVCQGFQDGVSFGGQVQAFTESDAKPSTDQAEALVRSAVRNLCPEYQSMLP